MSTSTAGRVACEPRTAFVLAGGAALGAMQAGMVHALYEHGIAPDLLIGTSAGALNAAFLASRPATAATAEDLAALWRGLRRRDILPLRPATLLGGLAGRRDHLIPDRALRRLAARHLQFERLEQAAIPLYLVAFDLLAGTEVRLSDGPAIDAVLAAAAIPGCCRPSAGAAGSSPTAGSPTTPRSHTPSRSAPGASTCCPRRTRATAACRARPGPHWPPWYMRSPCSPTPASTATSLATPGPPS